jgi:hypothetical protein
MVMLLGMADIRRNESSAVPYKIGGGGKQELHSIIVQALCIFLSAAVV